MHEVKCENCGKTLGIITDERVKGLRVYKPIETVVFAGDHGYIDGESQSSFGTLCSRCSNQTTNGGESK